MVHGASLMEVEIRDRNERSLGSFEGSTVGELKKAFYSKYPRYRPSRQYFTLGNKKDKVALKGDERRLTEFGVKLGSVLYFKDIGPQVGWRTVFFVEYFGPILIHTLFYYFPEAFYSQSMPRNGKTLAQRLAFALVIAHYFKREIESAFVHRFSNATMPLLNIFKNSFHYWMLGGISIAYFLYHPLYMQVLSDESVMILAAVFLICMFSNLACHIMLMNLRPPGTSVRRVPRGFLFEFVSCPNYFFEILSWVVFAVFTSTLTAAIFALVSAVQMYIWAVAKHRAYKKEFDGKGGRELYPQNRTSLIPFIF